MRLPAGTPVLSPRTKLKFWATKAGLSGYAAERIVIATGSRPAEIPGSPCDGFSIISSDEALDLHQLPATMAIIGSGAVGAEFANIFTKLGVKVTLIEAASRLFPAEDPEVDAVFRKSTHRMGVTVHIGRSGNGH